ncbi:MAG: hormogonium polysaccharide secretion pseudopilin HpsC [Rivularia sp. (in: cyanobacteria)]|jgi:prepilin-type N-terminal cleavage/methylation domain-containing protein
MTNKLQLIINNYFKTKRYHLAKKNSGFTLIELLVAMILAVLVITPLLGFMINILDTDRKEQAKVSSEQEIQTALDYIAQDLQQAIYIYDARGIAGYTDSVSGITVDGIKDKLPYSDDTDKVPVLVFWKRAFEKQAIDVTVDGTSQGQNDTFVYSLVVYYLIKGSSDNDTWSDQFRIARFELKDGIRNLDDPFDSDGDINYISEPDDGFTLFELNNPAITGTLEDKMNSWRKDETITNSTYGSNNAAVLVDYIDSSQDDSFTGDCATVFDLSRYTSTKEADKRKSLKVPAFEDTYQYSNSSELEVFSNNSFYACVDVDTVSAKIFLRGNALARIDPRNNNYAESRQSYFPSASVLVKGRGLIGTD